MTKTEKAIRQMETWAEMMILMATIRTTAGEKREITTVPLL